MPAPTNREFFDKLFRSGENYQLTRFVILRLLGFVYVIAFWVAIKQLIPLIGEHGLTPTSHFMAALETQLGSRSAAFWRLPSVFWFGNSDHALLTFSWIGLVLSLVVLAGYANAIILAAIWIIYMSIVHVGRIWYGYGWETQMLETTFLAIFLCPLLDPRPFPKRAPPILVIWLFRWLGFRIMIGAGLIKIRGDSCWRDLTCLYYHYETQPIPSPISRYLHFAPLWFHKLGTGWNHFVELIVPWFSFGPRHVRHVAGVLLVTFQVFLIISGNLSFLNYVTIVPFLACFDDSFWRRILPRALTKRVEEKREPSRWQFGAAAALTVLVVFLSIAPVANLFSARQLMNSSFDPFDLVNTYGAFGTVGRERDEIIFEGTSDETITGDTKWKEYEFVAKPGDPMRRPPFIAPYQPRIDWQIWFAARASPSEYPWTLNFVWKLLHNDAGTLSLLANNPFPDKPPHYIRARLYRYKFAPIGEKAWWQREPLGEWLPALSTDNETLKRALNQLDYD